MGDISYNNWKARLEGAKVPTHDGDPDAGFYRMPVRSPRSEGNAIIGWRPVAYFYATHEARMVGVIDDRDMTDNEVTDLWTYVCAYPVPEEVYRDVTEDGKPWPAGLIGEPKRAAPKPKANGNTASPAAVPTATAGRSVTKTDNQPPEALPEDVVLRERIENAKRVAEGYAGIGDDEAAAKAAGAKNLLNELKAKAETAKEIEYRPHKLAADAVANKWNPIIRIAEAAAKATDIEIRKWEQKKRDLAAKLAAEAAAKARAIEEANRRAADRAIANGAPEPAPVVAPPPPPPPPPKATVQATYGRAVSVREKTFVVIENLDEVYAHFKANAEVIDLLTKLAQRDIDAGLKVPGTTTRTGVI